MPRFCRSKSIFLDEKVTRKFSEVYNLLNQQGGFL